MVRYALMDTTHDECTKHVAELTEQRDAAQAQAHALLKERDELKDGYWKIVAQRDELLAAVKEAREALQFANDSPGGGISDTIWMMHRPETLFDFLDEAIAKAEKNAS